MGELETAGLQLDQRAVLFAPQEEAASSWLQRRVLFALLEYWREPVGRIRLIDSIAKGTLALWLRMNEMQQRSPLDSRYAAHIKRTRAKFVRELKIGPPKHFRVIDCRSTIEEQQVVLINWHNSKVAYTAVSHTFGMDAYAVFDCECASKCDAEIPRSSRQACPGHDVSASHAKIVRDIWNMCVRLRCAGAEYVWHDGVCIAQHDEAEVCETIKHMGWIYGHAKETIIFLHCVGNPVAPIRHDGDLISRWVTRVWTLQEAALSARRRYCLRRCGDLRHCQNLEQFEAEIPHWYEDDSSIAVVEEDAYLALLSELWVVLCRLTSQAMLQIKDPVSFLFKSWRRIQSLSCDSTGASSNHTGTTIATLYSLLSLIPRMTDAMSQIAPSLDLLEKSHKWLKHLIYLRSTCLATCCSFPTVESALTHCSFRDSKHEGDRINSILALAGVRDFVVPKDGNMASSTIEFFKRQGQDGLGRAVFSINLQGKEDDSWVPCLSRQLQPIQTDSFRSTFRSFPNGSGGMRDITVGTADYISYKVLGNGMIQLTGNLACLSVEFTFMAGRRIQRRIRRGRKSTESELMRMDLNISAEFGFLAYRELDAKMMGKAEICAHNCRPVFKDRVVEDGESFRVQLVYPVAALRYKANKENQICVPDYPELVGVVNSVPALIIQHGVHQATGNLQEAAEEAVSIKVGHFYVFPALQQILLANNNTIRTTRLKRLVLK